MRVFENTQAYPRAWFVDHVRRETAPEAVLEMVTAPGFDGRREALVESRSLPALPPPSDSARPAQAIARRDAPADLIVDTRTGEPRFLVVSEMYFPGWHAYIDKTETPIFRTNYLFRGIVVPAGRHIVRFEYRPVSVMIGTGVSCLALVIVAGLLL